MVAVVGRSPVGGQPSHGRVQEQRQTEVTQK